MKPRIQPNELAYRMQSAAPEAVDLSSESETTKKLHRMHEEITEKFGRKCLLARRLVERGVASSSSIAPVAAAGTPTLTWEENHSKNCEISDKPMAGLLTDLKARGLLDQTLSAIFTRRCFT